MSPRSWCCLAQILLDEVPVGAVTDRRNVALALVAVVDVISVLPDIDGEQAADAVRHGRVGVSGRRDLELAALLDQPGPAARELADRRLRKRVGELLVAAEILLQPVQQRPGR